MYRFIINFGYVFVMVIIFFLRPRSPIDIAEIAEVIHIMYHTNFFDIRPAVSNKSVPQDSKTRFSTEN